MDYILRDDGSTVLVFSKGEEAEVLILLRSLMYRDGYDKIALAEAIAVLEGCYNKTVQ